MIKVKYKNNFSPFSRLYANVLIYTLPFSQNIYPARWRQLKFRKFGAKPKIITNPNIKAVDALRLRQTYRLQVLSINFSLWTSVFKRSMSNHGLRYRVDRRESGSKIQNVNVVYRIKEN